MNAAGSTPAEVVFVGPVPPPVHGGALAMEFLMRLDGEVSLKHVNSRFADDSGALGRFSAGKVFLALRYAAQLMRFARERTCRWVVVTPTCYLGPFVKDALFIWISSFLLRKRTAAWLHMDFRVMRYERRSALVRWFVRRTLLRCDRFIVVSEGLRQLLPAWIPGNRVDAIANGVEVPDVLPSRLRPGAGIRILFLSNLAPDKGWRILLKAARQICSRRSEVEVVFHGKPAFEDTAEVIAAEFGGDDAGGRIRYEGAVYGERKWQALADADIFCFPSLHEAFPLSVLEAMAAGLPIVASRVGAVADALKDGNGGILVSPGSPDELEAALESMIGDAAFRKSAAQFNRERYLERYTVEAYLARWRDWIGRHGGSVNARTMG